MPIWIRCPHCDVAFAVQPGGADAVVQCDACGTRLGTLAEADRRVERPLDLRLAATLEGHTRDVWSVAFSPDGTLLATGSIDATVRLWDVETRALRFTLRGHADGVRTVAFSRDGRTLASASPDRTVRLWDVATGAERAVLHGCTGDALAFSADGAVLAAGGIDDVVRLWQTQTGGEREVLRTGRNNVRSIAFSPDGRWMAVGHFVNSGVALQVWTWPAACVHFAREGQSNVTGVRFSPDGTLLAASDLSGQLLLWDPSSGALRGGLTPLGRDQYFRPPSITSIAFAPGGALLALGLLILNGGNVQVWDVAAGQARGELRAHRQYVQSVDFSPDGTLLATGSRDRTVRLWRLPDAEIRA